MEHTPHENFLVHTLSKQDGTTDQDPDYNEAAPPDRKRLRHLEENAKSHLGERVKHILNNHFELEVNRQQNEIMEIDKSISQVQQKLQILRYVATKSFFSPKILQNNCAPLASQANMHPAVKCMLGKRPIKTSHASPIVSTPRVENFPSPASASTSENVKIPRYIPPKLPERIIAAPVRGELHYLKKKLIIGNVSRWIPVSERDDTASHKWMVYVRGPKEEPNISSFVNQVVFFLHPSYAPHDVVHVVSHPFHVTRRGWGEFPLRIQVHFHNSLCKPVNIIHNLKLDRSYTGLQTLGAETIVDVMVYDEKNVSTSSTSVTNETFPLVVDNSQQSDVTSHDGEQSTHHEQVQGNVHHSENEASGFLCQSTPPNQLANTINIKEEEMDVDDCSPTMEKTEISDYSELPVEETMKDSEDNLVPPACEFNNIDCDHDYFSTRNVPSSIKNTQCDAESTAILNSDNVVEQFRGAFSNLPTASCSSASALTITFPTSTANTTAKPVLVRCLNKNGTVFKLPLALLRNAVILQPYRTTKPGESLLRPLSTTPQELPVVALKSAVGKTVPSTAKPCLQSSKADSVRQDKLDIEAKFAKERQNLDSFLGKICSSNWKNVRDCVRILARSLTLIDTRAEDPVYRSVRPFTTSSLEIFDSWSMGKRRSAEWTRAKLIRQTLEKCNFPIVENIWSTKVIMIWCRRQGYSPLCCWLQTSTSHQSFALSSLASQEFCTLTKAQLQCPQLIAEEDVSIDVETLKERIEKPSSITQFPKASFMVNDPDPQLSSYITDSIEKCGFKLGTELHDGCLISFSRVLLTHVWRGLAEDLLRRSLRESWYRNRGSKPDEISLLDTYNAIIRRPQFDILTNVGLGVDDDGQC